MKQEFEPSQSEEKPSQINNIEKQPKGRERFANETLFRIGNHLRKSALVLGSSLFVGMLAYYGVSSGLNLLGYGEISTLAGYGALVATELPAYFYLSSRFKH